jgi:GNAT superfamily N-acetyltransferase
MIDMSVTTLIIMLIVTGDRVTRHAILTMSFSRARVCAPHARGSNARCRKLDSGEEHRVTQLFEVADESPYAAFREEWRILFLSSKGDEVTTSEPHRSKGHGPNILRELCELARTQQCAIIHLDSGVFRYRAHKFYLAHGFEIRAHHLLKRLDRNQSAFRPTSLPG